jgi:hypothetical protein
METRSLKCAGCKCYSNVKSTFKENETYNCESCGALNKINSKSGKIRYKIASLLTLLVVLFMISSCIEAGSKYGQGYFHFYSSMIPGMILPGIILCTMTYFGTLLVAKVSDWIFD